MTGEPAVTGALATFASGLCIDDLPADVVRQAQTKTQGSVTEAGVESIDGDTARLLVTASVKTRFSVALDPELVGSSVSMAAVLPRVSASATDAAPYAPTRPTKPRSAGLRSKLCAPTTQIVL